MSSDNTPPSPNAAKPSTGTDIAKDEKYAQALAQMATLEYDLKQTKEPPQKHLISKKVLIYLGISTVVGIVSLLIMWLTSRNSTPSQDGQQIQQLLDSAKEIQDLKDQ